MTATCLTHEISVHGIDTDDADEVESVVDSIGECAASADAFVDVAVISAESGTVIMEVSGHYLDLGAFMRRWEDDQ